MEAQNHQGDISVTSERGGRIRSSKTVIKAMARLSNSALSRYLAKVTAQRIAFLILVNKKRRLYGVVFLCINSEQEESASCSPSLKVKQEFASLIVHVSLIWCHLLTHSRKHTTPWHHLSMYFPSVRQWVKEVQISSSCRDLAARLKQKQASSLQRYFLQPNELHETNHELLPAKIIFQLSRMWPGVFIYPLVLKNKEIHR